MSSSAELTGARRAIRIGLLLAPALSVVGLLFGGGLALGVAQSLGYQPYLPGWSWSPRAYRAMWADPAVRASIGLTLRLSLTSTLVATVLGVGCALLVSSLRRGRRAISAVLSSTLPVPHLVGAVAMLLLLSGSGLFSRLAHAFGLTGSPADFPALTADPLGWGILAEYVWKETPFVAVIALTALTGGVAELGTVARSLGAGRWQRFWYVTLPLIRPGVTAGAVLVLAFTFGSYEVPLLLGRPFPAVLPVVALQYSQQVDLRQRPVALAIAVLVAVLVTTVVLLTLAVLERSARRSWAGR